MLIALIAGSGVLFETLDLDLRLQRSLWDASTRAWRLADEPWVHALEKVPGLLLLGFVLVGAPLYVVAHRRRTPHLRSHLQYLLVTLLLGPGLVVNILCKDLWGRHRWRQRDRDRAVAAGPQPIVVRSRP